MGKIVKDSLPRSCRCYFEDASTCIQVSKDECMARGVIISLKDKNEFWGTFLAAVEQGIPVFLCNPNWREAEWDEVRGLINPAIVFGNNVGGWKERTNRLLESYRDCIMIPTGGTSGKLKFAIHAWSNLECSALATKHFFGVTKINCVSVLPIYHVSGLMQAVRAYVTGGVCRFVELEDLCSSIFDENAQEEFFLSLVPTQLAKLLPCKKSLEALRRFKIIFVGGAHLCDALFNQAKAQGLKISLVYGSTETASMITATHPKAQVLMSNICGQPLEHVEFIHNENHEVKGIRCRSLFYGYFPQVPEVQECWVPSDFLSLNHSGELLVHGRIDRMINTGGEKVDPGEVEDKLNALSFFENILVVGVPDGYWGERVVVFYESKELNVDVEAVKGKLKESISNHKVPRDFIKVDTLPFDEKGKISKAKIEELWGHHMKSCSSK